MTFEMFRDATFREPGEDGVFIVNGDTPIANEKLLEEFFNAKIKKEREPLSGVELIVLLVGGMTGVWNSAEKKQLTYCVNTTFDDRHAQVVRDMDTATQAWESVSDLDFQYVSSEDGQCTAFNQNVVFDVRPVGHGEYLARAFFPNETRGARNVLIDNSSFALDPNDTLTLEGILRHELGHALGFRHEHTRPDSGTCFEDNDWKQLTDYDPFSVMHYPQCNGLGDWSLTLTAMDKEGSACLYGAAPGFSFDATQCPGAPTIPDPGPSTPGAPQTQDFSDQNVELDGEKRYGPFKVVPDTLFDALIAGVGSAGDPDLYVRFDQEPNTSVFDCRPYTMGADEKCSLDVQLGTRLAFVMVRGYKAGNYNLSVKHVPPAN